MDFFIIENGQQAGPFTIAQLAEKKITSGTLVWREGMPDWQPAWKVAELRYILEENRTDANRTTSPNDGEAAHEGPAVPPVPPTYQQANDYQQHDKAYQENPYNNGTFQGSQQFQGQGFQGSQQFQGQGFQGGQQFQSQPQKQKPKWIWKAVAAIVAILFIVLIASNPSRENHENAIRTEVSRAIDQATSTESNDIFSQGFRMMARMMAGNVIDSALDQLFEYHNYLLFSKGTIMLNGKSHTVSYGVLGKVITMNADDMVKALEKNGLNIEESSSSSSSDDSSIMDQNNESNNDDVQQSDDNSGNSNVDDKASSSNNGDEFEEIDDNDGVSGNIQKKLEDKTNQVTSKLKDKVKKKVEDKISQKLDEVASDSTTIEKIIDKILSLF